MEYPNRSLIDALNDLDKEVTFFDEVPHKSISPNSRLSDLVEFVNGFHIFKIDYESRKVNSPNWFITLELWISEIEKSVADFTSDENEFQPINNFKSESYIETLKGKDPYLYTFQDITTSNDLKDLAKGYIYAYKLFELKEELRVLTKDRQEKKNDLSELVFSKIVWKAGPAYLGFLIDELERNGYIEIPQTSNLNQKAEYILKIFDCKTTINSLSKMLSENSTALSANGRAKMTIKPPLKEKGNKT